MEKDFSPQWKASSQARKQRKYKANLPAHVRSSLLGSRLDDALSKKLSRRTLVSRVGDTVKVMRGSHRGASGKIARVDVGRSLLFIEGVQVAKRDGTSSPVGIHASNVMLTQIHEEDKRRVKQ